MKSKPECITVMGLKTKYGGGRSTGMALIYDSADMRAIPVDLPPPYLVLSPMTVMHSG